MSFLVMPRTEIEKGIKGAQQVKGCGGAVERIYELESNENQISNPNSVSC